MTERPILAPTAEYPITVSPTGRRVTVRVGGEIVADTERALTLAEATRPPVYYLPLDDVVPGRLHRTATVSYCPFKGDADYYSITTTAGDTVTDAVWSYEQPFPAVAAIAGHVAFYPEKVEISVGNP